jgi:hypothetical protein
MKATRFEVDGTRIWGGSQVLFRLLASNGPNTASEVAGPITVTQSPKLTLDQATLDFLNGTVGQMAERTLLLSNTGSGPLTASGQIQAGPYNLILGGGNLVIPAEEQRAITVRWTPSSTGSQQGTLALSSSDPSLAGVNVELSGVAFDTPVPAIRLGSTSLNFDSVNSGQTKDLKFTVVNAGADTLTVGSITSSNPRFGVSAPALPITILAGRSADVTVRFSPNASGALSATLSVVSNDPARSVVTVALTGAGAAGPAPSISLAPASLDFGAVSTGQTKDSKLTIGNAGTADLTLRSILSSGADFTLVNATLPVTLVPGRSTDITVRFAPSAAGPASASLTIASNDPARPSLALSMTGSGLTSVVSSVLTTIAYHEITALTVPLDIYNMPVISRSGNRAVFTVSATDLWAINPDGTGLLKVDTDPHPNSRFFSISDDGAKALIWNGTFLRVVNTDGSGGSTVLTSHRLPWNRVAERAAAVTAAVACRTRVAVEEDHGLSPQVDSGVVVPVVLGRYGAVAREHERAVRNVDALRRMGEPRDVRRHERWGQVLAAHVERELRNAHHGRHLERNVLRVALGAPWRETRAAERRGDVCERAVLAACAGGAPLVGVGGEHLHVLRDGRAVDRVPSAQEVRGVRAIAARGADQSDACRPHDPGPERREVSGSTPHFDLRFVRSGSGDRNHATLIGGPGLGSGAHASSASSSSNALMRLRRAGEGAVTTRKNQ